jgi:hypothetical protein
MEEKMPMQKLLDVQRVDLKIQDLETEAVSIPRQIQEWDSTLHVRTSELAAVRKELEEKKKEQRALERKLDQKQAELAKFNAQLPQIKTNREYKAILVEIDMVEKEISDIEEEILTKMTEADDLEERARASEAKLRQAQEETEKEKERLRERQRDLEQALQGSRSERENLAAGVDRSILSIYDRVRVRKGGLGIAQIHDESCGACHMALPPQVVNEVLGGKIKSCPSCSRLLYSQDG